MAPSAASAGDASQPAALGRYRELVGVQAEAEAAGMPVAIEGVAGTPEGAIVVELVPPEAERAALQVGDTYPSTVVAAAEVADDGTYQVRIDPASEALIADGELFLVHLNDGGHLLGVGAASLDFNDGAAPETPAASGLRASARAGGPTLRGVEVVNLEVVNMAAADVQIPELVELRPGWCHWEVTERGIMVPATVIVAGTNTRTATIRATFAQDATSELGVAVKAGAGGWAEASGSWKVRNSSGFTKEWPASNAYGTYSYRMEVEYARERYECYSGITERLVPVGYTGGNYSPVRWATTQYPEYCTVQSAGKITMDSSRATTWSGGAKLAWKIAGSVNVSSQSGYSTTTTVEVTYTADNKRLCGRYGYPGQGTPGYVMADHKDR
jgi:hypothetical protein